MDDTIAYRIGSLKTVIRDDPIYIECVEKNLLLMGGQSGVHYRTADSSDINNMNDLFRGLA